MSADDFSPDSSDAVAWYGEYAEAIVARHESLAPEKVNAWLADVLPNQPALVLDVGAGSGRDAAWLASRGHEVIAVEPSEQMRIRGLGLHRVNRIRWINDLLPGLENVRRLRISFDFILLNAVWMHVAPASRRRAFRKLVTLLKPGAWMAISFASLNQAIRVRCSPATWMSLSNSPESTALSSKESKRWATSLLARESSGRERSSGCRTMEPALCRSFVTSF